MTRVTDGMAVLFRDVRNKDEDDISVDLLDRKGRCLPKNFSAGISLGIPVNSGLLHRFQQKR